MIGFGYRELGLAPFWSIASRIYDGNSLSKMMQKMNLFASPAASRTQRRWSCPSRMIQGHPYRSTWLGLAIGSRAWLLFGWFREETTMERALAKWYIKMYLFASPAASRTQRRVFCPSRMIQRHPYRSTWLGFAIGSRAWRLFGWFRVETTIETA